jgi:hypothetical protein
MERPDETRLGHLLGYGMGYLRDRWMARLEGVSRETRGYWETRTLLDKTIPEHYDAVNRQILGQTGLSLPDEEVWRLARFGWDVLMRAAEESLETLERGRGEDLKRLLEPMPREEREEAEREAEEAWSRLRGRWLSDGTPAGFDPKLRI